MRFIISEMSDKKRTFVAAKVLNVEECATTATILEAIHFDEIIHTDTRAIVTEVAELFRVRTLKQLIDQSAIAARHLVDVGLFVDASVVVDVAKAPNSYVLNFHVVEHSPINVYISSHIQVSNLLNTSHIFY
jgi:ribulose 1,5-bisphosphate synthetase/thiazole synthase